MKGEKMNIALRDYVDFMKVLCDEYPEFSEVEIPVNEVLAVLPKNFVENRQLMEFLKLLFDSAAEIGVERKCSDFRKELENF